jgi:zinc transporter 1/2/3
MELGEVPARVIPRTSIPGREDDFSYPPGGEDHLGHQRDHMIDDDHFAAQMTAIFILEFGVIFHSVFIGLTLAVAGSNFNVLYIVLVFHQTFEGLGLGSRLATAEWPKRKWWLPWVLGAAYGCTTPIAIAIGLGVQTTFTPGSPKTMIVNGVFDSISAGILIYTGLVELMAHEFMIGLGVPGRETEQRLLGLLQELRSRGHAWKGVWRWYMSACACETCSCNSVVCIEAFHII